MRQDLDRKSICVTLGIFSLIGLGIIFPGTTLSNPKTIVSQPVLISKGGTELLLQPDYRLNDPALQVLGEDLIKMVGEHHIPVSAMELIGTGEKGTILLYYDHFIEPMKGADSP